MDPSPKAVRAITEVGYVFLFPLVANYAVMYSEAIDPSSPRFAGGFGQWSHHRWASSHETRLESTHVTTLDSSAWLDLRAEPWLLSIAPPGCGHTTAVTDLWGFVVGESGAGSDDHPVVVAGTCIDDHDLPADLVEAIGQGMDDALTELLRTANDPGDHTPTKRSRPDTDRDYFGRALAALRSIPPIGSFETPGPRT